MVRIRFPPAESLRTIGGINGLLFHQMVHGADI